MPTENRSSNTEMVSELLPCPFCGEKPQITKHHREDIYSFMHRCPVLGPISWGFREDQQAHIEKWNARAQPAPQPHPEPIAWMVGTAFWWTKEEADRDAAATGLPIVGLGPMTDRAAIELAECESMADMVAEREWAEHAGTGPVSSKVEAAFTQLHNDLHEAGGTLAERDALLRELADAPPAAMEFRLQQKVKAALSASAEPSAPGVLPRAHDVNMFQRTAEPGAKS